MVWPRKGQTQALSPHGVCNLAVETRQPASDENPQSSPVYDKVYSDWYNQQTR